MTPVGNPRSSAASSPTLIATVVVTVVVLITGAAGCSYYAGPGRGTTAVIDATFPATEAGAEHRELSLTIAACNARPFVAFQEDADEVVVSVDAQLPGRDSEDCADEVTIVLDGPLGQRSLIDASTGATIPVGDQAAG